MHQSVRVEMKDQIAMTKLDDAARIERENMIVEQYSGIYPPYEAFYIHSIIYAADRSKNAFRRFDDTIASQAEPALVVSTVQEALAHAGALSRFFWPVRKRQLVAARGHRLREAFKVDDESALKSRQLRNVFEHFDEYLDCFLLNDSVGYFFPAPMVDNQALADEAIGHIFKLVDPENEICVLLGQKFEFRPVRNEVERILTIAQAMDNRGCRL